MRTCICDCIAGSPRTVLLHEGVDSSYVVGTCSHCGKRFIFKKNEIPEEKFNPQDYFKKKVKAKRKFSGDSKWREENGMFQAKEGR
jgi:hypothetical protein